MSQLSVRDLSMVFGRGDAATIALDGVSFDLADGEVLAVLGPSGCGKSTLLRVIAGLVDGSGGSVMVDGRPIDDVEVHRRGFGLMFQNHALFDHQDVATNIGFGLEMAGMQSADRNRRVDELLELVGLEDFGPRSVATLSGGEAQRVALARALAPEPRLLLLDEPLASLDRQRRDALVGELGSILGGVGQTAIYVTHDRDEAFAIADRVAIMRSGRIERIGTPREVWADPRSRFVADFIGHRTVVRLRHPSGDVRWASVPADALRLAERDSRTALELEVRSVRFRGDRTDGDAVDDQGQWFAVPSSLPLAIGDRVRVAIDDALVAWLDDD